MTGINNREIETSTDAESRSREGTGSRRDNNGYGQKEDNFKDRTLRGKNDELPGRELLRQDDDIDAKRETTSNSQEQSEGSKRADKRSGEEISERTSGQGYGFHENSSDQEPGTNGSRGSGNERSDLSTTVNEVFYHGTSLKSRYMYENCKIYEQIEIGTWRSSGQRRIWMKDRGVKLEK